MGNIYYDVNVEFEDGQEETVEVEIDMEKFEECGDDSKKIAYIKKITKEQHNNIKKVNFAEEDLKEVQDEINDVFDTSDFHPNEPYDEFVEHENFD